MSHIIFSAIYPTLSIFHSISHGQNLSPASKNPKRFGLFRIFAPIPFLLNFPQNSCANLFLYFVFLIVLFIVLKFSRHLF